MPRFAANLSMLFTEQPFLPRFARARAAGFTAVEYLFPYDHAPEDLAAELRRHGLTQVLFNLPPGDWAAGERGLAALPGRQDDFRASVATALRYAQALGCTRLHAMAGQTPDGVPLHELRQTYLGNLRVAAGMAARHGITVLIEPINPRAMPGYYLSDVDAAAALVAEAEMANLKLQFDVFHAQIIHGDLTARLRRYAPIIDHVQIAGVPARHEPDTGEVAYAHVFALLDELGYDGWVGCEYHPAGETEAGLGWFAPYRAASAR